MGKLIITPEILALKAEREASEKRKEQDRLPPRVAAFWFAQEADVPAWRMETSEERERLRRAGVCRRALAVSEENQKYAVRSRLNDKSDR